MIETVQVKIARKQAVDAVKSTIDYRRLNMKESMLINSHIEATINKLICRVPTKSLKGMAIT